MAWFKVDDGFHSSRKLLSIPKRHRLAAAGLWAVAGSWCADQLTDGHIPDYMLKEWGATPSTVTALVDSGLWERTSDAHLFANWLEYQPSKRDVDAEREASRARMRELRAKRKQRKPQDRAATGEVFGRTVPNGSENVRNPDPTHPDPTHISTKDIEQPAVARAPKAPNRFEEFWAAYPRKVDKKKAKDAFDVATKTVDPEIIIAGAKRHALDPNRDDRYTKHPTTWLRAGSWDNDPLPPRNDTSESQAMKNARSIQQRFHQPQALDEPWLIGGPNGNPERN